MLYTFPHVADAGLRAVLEGTDAPSSTALTACMQQSQDALEADYLNEDIPYKAIAIRENALMDMEDDLAAGDTQAALTALRRFWSN